MSGNRLFHALPTEIRERLTPREEKARLRDVLFRQHETVDDVFFPHPGTVVSMTRATADGAMVEIGVAGSEGVAGIQSVLTAGRPHSEGVVQMEGRVTRVAVSRLREMLEDRQTREVLLAYTSFYLDQVSQNVVCNGLHMIEQRLAKWLLVMRDRTGALRLSLTQEFLAYMLGVRRSGVSVAVGALTAQGVIAHGRNTIEIIDNDGLEARSCDCYAAIRDAASEYEARLAALR